MKYEIQVYDDSPSMGDARNPSIKLIDISVDCSLGDFLILCRKVRSIWPESQHIHLYAQETVSEYRRIEWKD